MLKRLGLALGISLCLSATYLSAAETFRVLSYNVENLWDDEPYNSSDTWRSFLDTLNGNDRNILLSHSLQYDDYSMEGSNWYTPEVLDAKIQQIIQVVKMAGEPEILALQEIESAGNRSHIFDMHGKKFYFREEFEKLGYRYFILGNQNEKNPVSVTQAVISKLPINELPSVDIEFDDEPHSTSARDAQVIEFKEGNNRMLIINNHWKSKIGGKKTEEVRVRTAQLVRERIFEELKKTPDTRVIVLGDFNSSYYERPILALATGDEGNMVQDKTDLLYNTWYELPESKRWETSYRGKRQTLSGMMISDAFYLQGGIQYVDQSFQVIGQSGPASKKLLTENGVPHRWETRKADSYTTHLGKGYSDHLPLIASFRIGQASSPRAKVVLPKH